MRMEDAMTIRQRAYDKICNHITETLTPLLKDQNMKLEMVRSGVVINDIKEVFTIVGGNMTIGSFVVDRNTFKVLQTNIYPIAFTEELGVFHKRDYSRIYDYIKSFNGLCLEPYKKEDQYE